MTSPGVDRRSALFASVVTGAGLAFPFSAAPASAAATVSRGGGSCTTPRSAIARTQYGNDEHRLVRHLHPLARDDITHSKAPSGDVAK